MVRTPPSRADTALLRELAADHGTTVSAAQLERWRTFGLLPRSVVAFPGDGGSTAALPEGTREQALFLASRFRRGKSRHLVALEVARAGRWLTGEAASAALRWAVQRNRAARLEWMSRYQPYVDAELAEEESDAEHDRVIAGATAVADEARRSGSGLSIGESLRRARPDLRGEELLGEIERSHMAILQVAAGNELSPEERERALLGLGLDPGADGADGAFALLRLLADVDALPELADQLTPARALSGCRSAAERLSTAPVPVPPEAFAAIAVVLAPEDDDPTS